MSRDKSLTSLNLPDPVSRQGEGDDIEDGEHQERLEVAPLRHGARHYRGGEGGQGQLVEEGESPLSFYTVVPGQEK